MNAPQDNQILRLPRHQKRSLVHCTKPNSLLDVEMTETNGTMIAQKRQRCVSPEHCNDDELGGVEDGPFFYCLDHDQRGDEDDRETEEEAINQTLSILDDLEVQSISKQFKLRSKNQRNDEKIKFSICKTLTLFIQPENYLCGRTHSDRLDLILSVRQLLLEMEKMDLSVEYLQGKLEELLLSRSSLFPPRAITLPSFVNSMEIEDIFRPPTETRPDDLDRFRDEIVSKGKALLERLSMKNQALLTERTKLLSKSDVDAENVLVERIEDLEGMHEIASLWIHYLKSNCHASTACRRDLLEIASDAFQTGEENVQGLLWNFAFFVCVWKTE